jgi:hypothetical protein
MFNFPNFLLKRGKMPCSTRLSLLLQTKTNHLSHTKLNVRVQFGTRPSQYQAQNAEADSVVQSALVTVVKSLTVSDGNAAGV